MKLNKPSIMSILLTIFISILLFTVGFVDKNYDTPLDVYQIYLDGEKIGMIEDKDEFYDLINQEQADIRETYQVDQVYPPKGFEIIAYRTYDDNIVESAQIYNSIKNEREFTLKGYTITIKSNTEDEEQVITTINVLDRQVFEDAINQYISTFIGQEAYENYLNDTQEEIIDEGETIENMYFNDNITIKESYINIDEEIYTNSKDLVRRLLFGDNVEEKTYKVKVGDTLESIAYENKLNVQELLIANEDISNEKALISINQEINVSLINPVLSLVYDLEVREIIEEPYKTEKKYDNSRYSSYKKTETPGINGLTRITKQVRMINGEMSQDAWIDENKTEIIRSPQNEVIVYGTLYSGGGTSVIPSGESWALPTIFPYVITSEYGYRWGDFHDGIDISGTGYGSPIFAVYEGEVFSAGWGGIVGENAGYNVVIKHPNGYWSTYSHMSHMPSVKAGDYVQQGQQIGRMGQSGWTTGVHLHLSIFTGIPYNGGSHINPRRVILF